jgi:acetyl-CoA/propionyl-CoA carboxylase biotin carboxyl carrier protein
MTLESVLVANRGEIAVRVIRSAKEMGLRTIAVYSDLDRDALHVDLADEAWNIGGAPAAESYLDMDRILAVAVESGAASIHPGYGFLAENPVFAQRVIDSGIVWVGPSPEAIRTMGDKIASRKAAIAAGVPTVPGTTEPLSSVDEIASVADEYGYPVAIKAAHGGGGKGLRVVQSADGLEDAFEGARREADAYFGNPEVYVEKYLERPRHVEAQILVDDHGTALFLGERDCSVQRRHQKLVEETPSPGLDDTTRAAIGEAALAMAAACGYRNAGTVEFLLDDDGTTFYFLEMNTRLQVEHTVTEMVTGVDIVAEQLRIADGEPLSIGSVTPFGHAIELRVNAEDAAAGFVPNPGTIVDYREPAGYGVRVDSWVGPGSTVSQYYDNLIAKLVVWAPDRERAIARALRAIDEYQITGVATTLPAHRVVLEHPDFVAGEHYTKRVEDHVDFGATSHDAAPVVAEDEALTERSMTVEVGSRRFAVRFWAPAPVAPGPGAQRRRPPARKGPSGPSTSGDGIIIAPMQGTIVKLSVAAGDSVEAGDSLLVLEAMKMENSVTSPVDGVVVELRVQAGDAVGPGDVLAVVK